MKKLKMDSHENNDDLDKLVSEINTKNIIKESEEKSKNRLNSTEAYIGYLIAFVSIGYTVILSFLPNLEESCSEYYEYYSEVYDLMFSYSTEEVELKNEWNAFVNFTNSENYNTISSAEQLNEFDNIFINWNTNINKVKLEQKAYSNIKEFDTDGIHSDILPLVDLGYKYFDIYKTAIDNLVKKYEFQNKQIENHKTFFLDWEIASSNEDKDEVQESFNSASESNIDKIISLINERETLITNFNVALENFNQMSVDICNWTFDE
jgi:hypothetical protein